MPPPPPQPQLPPGENPGRIVFVGNIPYGLTEEQISDIFSNAGRVINFRLVYDHNTGRPKGFGFAEYQDPETAASAVRNLNDYEIMGRKLRVDFSHEEAADFENQGSYQPNNHNNNNNMNQGGGGGGGGGMGGGPSGPPPIQLGGGVGGGGGNNPVMLPPLPAGVEPPPNLSAPDAISRTLAQMPPGQLLEVITQMKHLVNNDPARATELLRQTPQLSYALFQAMLLMNLVDTSVLSQVIEQSAQGGGAAPQQQQQQQQQPLPQQQQQRPPQPPPIPPPQQAYAPPQQQQGAANSAEAEKARLIQQVLSMTNEQIMALPQEQRGAIMMLRQQLMSGAQI